jgi:hypothetical protein
VAKSEEQQGLLRPGTKLIRLVREVAAHMGLNEAEFTTKQRQELAAEVQEVLKHYVLPPPEVVQPNAASKGNRASQTPNLNLEALFVRLIVPAEECGSDNLYERFQPIRF